MKKIIVSALLAASCLSVSTAAFAQTDAERLDNLETRLMGIERRATSGATADGTSMLADHEARLQALESETSRVYGKAEEVGNAIEVLAKKVEMIAKDLELRLQDIEKAISEGATAAPAAKAAAKKRNDAPVAQAASTPIPNEISADDMYQKSYDLMKAGSYADAEAWFKEFLVRNPQHARAENAYYWLGEVYLAQNRAEEALVAFRDGIRAFPSGNKTADSLLKMGVAFEQIGKADLAKTTWEKLVREFPTSASANSAKQKLGNKN